METARTLIRWAATPVLFVLVFGAGLAAIAFGWDYQRIYGIAVFGLVILLAILEAIFPLRREWKMTWRSFRRDLKYIAAGSMVAGGVNYAFGFVALALADAHAPSLSAAPLALQVALALFTFEALNYAQHRASHELPGAFGRHLWHAHVAHHLPDRLYTLMHAAFHPFNALIVRALCTLLPLKLLGISAEATLLFNLYLNFAGVISHANLDLRAGPLNYLIAGPELHRYHHSAEPREARNYAAALPIYDLVFGTFVYRPGVFPERIGVAEPAAYPDSSEFWKVMRLPVA